MTSAPPAPRVSVVVLTFDRPDSLRRCLESLTTQTLPTNTFEVVVVDVSRPSVESVIADFSGRLRVVHHAGANLGVAANRNTGVALGGAPIVAFLDDDCVASPQWLESVTHAVELRPGCLAGGLVEGPRTANAVAVAGQIIAEGVDAFYNPPEREPRFLPGLNFACERERYLALGGCDEGFGTLAAEDRDFVDRWRLAGGTLVSCPRATVRHEHRSSLSGFVRQHVNYGRGAWRYHAARRRRQSGRMIDDLRLHASLHDFLGPPLRRLEPRLRAEVIVLLALWQAANLAGFAAQAVSDTLPRRLARRRAGA